MDFRIEGLTRRHIRDSFTCGEPSLDRYIKELARQNDDMGLGKTFVAVNVDSLVVLGYYTLAATSIDFDKLPQHRKLPRYPIPAVLLARLAVDVPAQGQGLGEFLLLDALRRCAQTADSIAAYAVLVHALHQHARNFYVRYGFEPLDDSELGLYLTMKKVRKLPLI